MSSNKMYGICDFCTRPADEVILVRPSPRVRTVSEPWESGPDEQHYRLKFCSRCIKLYQGYNGDKVIADYKKIQRQRADNPEYYAMQGLRPPKDNPYLEIKDTTPKTPMKNKTAIELEIKKDKSKIYLKIKAEPELEEFFKELCAGQVAESAAWFDKDGKGLKFYKIPEDKVGTLRDTLQKGVLKMGRQLDIINDFGSSQTGLMRGNRINVAILRVVGLSEGVEIQTQELIGYEEIKIYIENLSYVVKELYYEYLKLSALSAKITFEI